MKGLSVGGRVCPQKIITAAVVAILVFAGCLSYTVQSVAVSAEGGAAAMNAGETLRFTSEVAATGKDLAGSERVNWTVASTQDGKGPVTSGTNISPSGVLTVSVDEIYPVLYVKAVSASYTSVFDYKQIQISGPKVGSVTLTSAGSAASVAVGGTLKFNAVAAGRGVNQGIAFSVGSVSGGTGPVAAGTSIGADGTLTVAAGEAANSLFVRAVSETDATKFDTKQVQVVAVTGVSVTANGGAARVARGERLQFTAAVTGRNNPAATVTWKVSTTADGNGAVTSGTTVASDGTLTVAAGEAAATVYVIAVSTIDTTKSGSLAVVIPTVTGITISPASASVRRGEGQTFRGTVQGTGDPGREVTWKVEGVGGTAASAITTNGVLTVSAAETLSSLVITASSVANPEKTATAMVTIPAVPAAVVPATPAPSAVSAANDPSQYDSEADFTVTAQGSGVSITGYKGTNQAVRIPGMIGGKPVLSIGRSAFSKNQTITSVTIPNGVTTIGQDAFSSCPNLASVSLPNTLTTIEANAFFNCTKITSITIPASVRTLSGFQMCTGLTSVTIPNGVTSIGDVAFLSCSGLTSVIIPNSVTNIGSSAFDKCINLSSVTIPNSVTSIGGLAFYNCTSLTSVNIPASVTKIAVSAYGLCTRLTSITVDAANTVYSSQDGVLYNKAKTSLLLCPVGKTGALTIPNSVIIIESNAFERCTSLTSVTIPNSVTIIGGGAFYGCAGFTSVTIPASVLNIYENAFYFCNNLASVTFLGTIPGTFDGIAFPGDMKDKFYATDKTRGTPGTYVPDKVPISMSTKWTKQ